MAALANADGVRELDRVANLFGGSRILRRRLDAPLDAHEMLLRGLPAAALSHLIDNLAVLRNSTELEKAIGISLRTLQRRKAAAAKPLSREQSGRLWKFAEVLAKATDVFGSQEDAEAWMQAPVMALDHRRPIDLLATPAGTEMVETFLRRLRFGVYL